MREIVLDTETTGLDPGDGHRVVEIACLELSNHIPTGRHYQVYLNPERDVPADASAIHGLTTQVLADKPRFGEIVEKFLEFVSDAPLVIHNAEFDMRFLNAELTRAGKPGLDYTRAVDRCCWRAEIPAPASLDALWPAIDNSAQFLARCWVGSSVGLSRADRRPPAGWNWWRHGRACGLSRSWASARRGRRVPMPPAQPNLRPMPNCSSSSGNRSGMGEARP
jgi:hypothetical protein